MIFFPDFAMSKVISLLTSRKRLTVTVCAVNINFNVDLFLTSSLNTWNNLDLYFTVAFYVPLNEDPKDLTDLGHTLTSTLLKRFSVKITSLVFQIVLLIAVGGMTKVGYKRSACQSQTSFRSCFDNQKPTQVCLFPQQRGLCSSKTSSHVTHNIMRKSSYRNIHSSKDSQLVLKDL